MLGDVHSMAQTGISKYVNFLLRTHLVVDIIDLFHFLKVFTYVSDVLHGAIDVDEAGD